MATSAGSRPGEVLTPYQAVRAGRRWRPLSLLGLAVYCGLTGAALALLPPQLMFTLAVPPILGVAFILWLLPDGGHVPEKSMATLLVAWIVANALWPNYLALDLPGLPWINPSRIISFALLAMGLVAFSSSSKLRGETSAVLRALPVLGFAFWAFWAMTVITIPLSGAVPYSLNKWFNNQIFWTFMFVLAAWLATKPGTMTRVARVLVWSAILVSCEAVYEYSIQMVPWANSIPSWLKVDEALMGNVLTGGTRSGTDIYRARGTFNHPLILAEYLGIMYPFMVHATIKARSPLAKSALILGLLVTLAAMYLTNARSGMIGFFMSVFLYGGFAAFRYWRRRRDSLIGVSTISMLPIAAIAFLMLSLTWTRLHNMTFGGGQHQPSSDARAAQWNQGMPKVWSNPVGHGPGRAGETLSYYNLGGEGTIDTYYLSLLLEYGFVGFLSFMVMFAWQAVYGLRMFLIADDGEESLVGPATIGLLNFVVIKSVLSSEFNMPLAFVFLGFLFAIALRQRARLGSVAATPSYGLRPAAA